MRLRSPLTAAATGLMPVTTYSDGTVRRSHARTIARWRRSGDRAPTASSRGRTIGSAESRVRGSRVGRDPDATPDRSPAATTEAARHATRALIVLLWRAGL